eukprot:Skav235996  [mRNA]  locus=scaffold348:316362:323888:+ [translate_table: standard]
MCFATWELRVLPAWSWPTAAACLIELSGTGTNQPLPMPSGFDYSKWDNIELSDDEEDVHPNIDKASWFRYKHQNRVEKDEDEERKQLNLEKELQKLRKEYDSFGEGGKEHLKAKKVKSQMEKVEQDLETLLKNKTHGGSGGSLLETQG